MKKRIVSLLLSLLFVVGCLISTATAVAAKSWSYIYRDFIFNGTYNNYKSYFGQDYKNNPKFALYDMSNDGIPELILDNNAGYEAGTFNSIFTIVNGSVKYLGVAGGRIGLFNYSSNKVFYGLYWENGNMGHYYGRYYYVQNNKLIEVPILERINPDIYNIYGSSKPIYEKYNGDYYVKLTSSTDAYNALKKTENTLYVYSVSEIRSMGWDAFIKRCKCTVSDTFTDVKAGQWYVSPIQYVVDCDYFAGTSGKTFAPNTQMTRAMVVNVLNKMSGSPVASRSYGFSDVKAGQWYTNAVNWAAVNGIVSGVGYNQFWPNAGVTREQLATILYQYAKYRKINLIFNGSKYNTFSDRTSVSSYAVKAMQWCTNHGIISGVKETSGTYLRPKKGATRAEVATVIKAFCAKYGI